MNMERGTISGWKDEKGFGFIAPKSGGKTIFFHINNYSKTHKRPLKNLEVQYSISIDQQGRKKAIEVCPIKGHKNNGRELTQKFNSIILFGAFSIVLFYLYSSNLIPVELVYLYIIICVITFLMYAKDKNAAISKKWRTPENTLHMLSLLGGWPGAKIAQSFLRHKSKKMEFRVTYWVTVIANCGVLYWLVTPKGRMWLESILRNINFG